MTEKQIQAIYSVVAHMYAEEPFPVYVANEQPWVVQFDPSYTPTLGELNFMPSETIPDQSMSVTEIMRRYASGLPLGGERVPMYDDENEDNDLPDLNNMDLADREAYIDSVKGELSTLTTKLNQPPPESKPKKDQKPDDHLTKLEEEPDDPRLNL